MDERRMEASDGALSHAMRVDRSVPRGIRSARLRIGRGEYRMLEGTNEVETLQGRFWKQIWSCSKLASG